MRGGDPRASATTHQRGTRKTGYGTQHLKNPGKNQNTSDGCREMSREACVTQGARRIARVAEFGREGERYEDLADKLNSRFVIHSKLAASQ